MQFAKQLRCPSCGANLELNSQYDLMVECPYCHQKVVNENAFQSQTSRITPHVLLFRKEENDIIHTMVDLLADDQSVPTDIFDLISISSIMRYYIPLYMFEGTFRAPWTTKIERREERQRISRDGKIENYYETLYDYPTGEAAGAFSVNCVPFEYREILQLDSSALQSIAINPASLPILSDSIIIEEGIELLKPLGDSDSLWRERGENTALRIATNAAYNQAPGYDTICSASCELKNTSLIYIPLWEIEYKYHRETYVFLSYAERVNTIKHPYCEVIQAQPTEEQSNIIGKYNVRNKILTYTKNVGCLSLIAVGLIVAKQMESYNWHTPGTWNDVSISSYLWKMFFLGVAFLLLIKVLKIYFRHKDCIDDIEQDIANRTNILQKRADDYRKKTAKRFLRQYGGVSDDISVAPEMSNSSKDNTDSPQEEELTHLHTDSSRQIKFCSHCGKEINSMHKFCRYCGQKLSII